MRSQPSHLYPFISPKSCQDPQGLKQEPPTKDLILCGPGKAEQQSIFAGEVAFFKQRKGRSGEGEGGVPGGCGKEFPPGEGKIETRRGGSMGGEGFRLRERAF